MSKPSIFYFAETQPLRVKGEEENDDDHDDADDDGLYTKCRTSYNSHLSDLIMMIVARFLG